MSRGFGKEITGEIRVEPVCKTQHAMFSRQRARVRQNADGQGALRLSRFGAVPGRREGGNEKRCIPGAVPRGCGQAGDTDAACDRSHDRTHNRHSRHHHACESLTHGSKIRRNPVAGQPLRPSRMEVRIPVPRLFRDPRCQSTVAGPNLCGNAPERQSALTGQDMDRSCRDPLCLHPPTEIADSRMDSSSCGVGSRMRNLDFTS